jgi:hypothetical protein
MRKFTLAGMASAALAATAIGLAAPALADDGTVALPPGGPSVVYPQQQGTGGANPYLPFGTNPLVPFGVWNANN